MYSVIEETWLGHDPGYCVTAVYGPFVDKESADTYANQRNTEVPDFKFYNVHHLVEGIL